MTPFHITLGNNHESAIIDCGLLPKTGITEGICVICRTYGNFSLYSVFIA